MPPGKRALTRPTPIGVIRSCLEPVVVLQRAEKLLGLALLDPRLVEHEPSEIGDLHEYSPPIAVVTRRSRSAALQAIRRPVPVLPRSIRGRARDSRSVQPVHTRPVAEPVQYTAHHLGRSPIHKQR
jgi:hypothetical protein